MSYIYIPNSAKNIKIAIIYKDDQVSNDLNSFFEKIFENIKVCQNFNLQIQVINYHDCQYEDYNLIFLIIPFSELDNHQEIVNNYIPNISNISYPRNRFYIIVDSCYDLMIDDDEELTYTDDNKNLKFQNFLKLLTDKVNENLFYIFKININMAIIWKTIIEDNSISNLSEEQINYLVQKINIKISKATSPTDVRKELKMILRKTDIPSKLTETGYDNFFSTVSLHLKLVNQKKIVCQNYLYQFNKIVIGPNKIEINNLICILKEIYGITFLKSETHDDLIDKIDNILFSKLNQFYHKCKNNISIGPNQTGIIDAYTYHSFLCEIMEIAKGYNLSNIMDITKKETKIVDGLIIDHHKQEMEKITDLEKIVSHLEIFAEKDRANLIRLFEKIRSHHPKIIQENINNMNKWVLFVDRCFKIGIPKELIMYLIEEVILYKIQFYSDTSRISSKDPSIIYPQCLHVFLLTNINKHFIFKKLFMFVSYSIRYSGRNIGEYIKNITQDQYQSLLILENKMLEICHENAEEPSQTINLNNVDIVETFNDILPKKKQCHKYIRNIV